MFRLTLALPLLVASLPGFAATPPIAADSIVVTAARLAQSQADVLGDLTLIERATLERFRGQSLADVLQQQAGVQFTSNGGPGKASSLFLRGSNAGHTIVLIDGVRWGSATLGSPSLQNLPVDQIERVEILRGAAASLYGSDAIGGVVQVFTRRGQNASQPSLSLGAGSDGQYQASGRLAGQSGKTRYALGLAHSYTDGVSSIANPANPGYYADRDGYQNSSLSAALSHQLAESLELGGNLLYARTESGYDSYVSDANWNSVAQSYDYRDKSTQTSGALWARAQFSPDWQAEFKAGNSRDESRSFTPLSATDLRDAPTSINTRQQSFSWQNDIALGGGTATLGVETLEQTVSGDTDYAVRKRRINSILAGYLITQDTLRGQINLRQDNNSQFGEHLSGQLGASWSFLPDWQLGSNLGTGFRAPSFNDLYWPGAESPDLQAEKSFNREAFLRYRSKPLQVSFTVYRNTVRNLIAWAPIAPGSWTWKPANIGRAQLSGSTLALDWQANGWLAGGHWDWLDAKDVSGGDNDGKQLLRRARQSGALYGGLRLGSLETRLEVVAQGKRYNDAANTSRLAGYGLLNLSASWQLTRDWQLAARINNLADKQYALVQDYGSLGRNGMLSLNWQPK